MAGALTYLLMPWPAGASTLVVFGHDIEDPCAAAGTATWTGVWLVSRLRPSDAGDCESGEFGGPGTSGRWGPMGGAIAGGVMSIFFSSPLIADAHTAISVDNGPAADGLPALTVDDPAGRPLPVREPPSVDVLTPGLHAGSFPPQALPAMPTLHHELPRMLPVALNQDNLAVVPEPSSVILLGTGLALAAARDFRRRQHRRCRRLEVASDGAQLATCQHNRPAAGRS